MIKRFSDLAIGDRFEWLSALGENADRFPRRLEKISAKSYVDHIGREHRVWLTWRKTWKPLESSRKKHA